MHYKLYALLNIKPSEYKIVRQLFLVQFFLGIATAFLFTSTLTMFLQAFKVEHIPEVYILAAFLLLLANWGYSRLEHQVTSRKLLQKIILFSAGSLLFTWVTISFHEFKWLPFLLSAWNMVVYMLVSYAFWGMAAIIFNVRESKRIFAVVGSGDIPAKLMGYAMVPVLTPLIGVNNLLWISVFAFLGAYYFLGRFQHRVIDRPVHAPHADSVPPSSENRYFSSSLITQIFYNKLIFSIALFSLIAFTVFSLIDFTLLGEVKARFANSPDLAIFIGMFFAIGRVMAIFFKLLFSSRVISRLGLTNSLLLSPVVVLILTSVLLLPGESPNTILYVFGVMVLLSEVLKSAVQEPAFFILFQPLEPHVRLKGHLIAKGYMLPFALLGSGLFLMLCYHLRGGISIQFIAQVLFVLLVAWVGSVFLVKKEYFGTLVMAIKKGWFTGSELFLSDGPVQQLLLNKATSANPKDVLLALELLERSGYRRLEQLLEEQFYSPFYEVRRFVLGSLIRLQGRNVLGLVQQQLAKEGNDPLKPDLLKAYYSLIPEVTAPNQEALQTLDAEAYQAALVGLLQRPEAETHKVVHQELEPLVKDFGNVRQQQLVLDILSEASATGFQEELAQLLASDYEQIYKKAIETIGKVQEHSLLEFMVETAKAREAWHALQKSLVYFGDTVFSAEVLHARAPAGFVRAVVLAAGKVRGEQSTEFLLDLLTEEEGPTPDVIEALWQKQAELTSEGKRTLEAWLTRTLASCLQKTSACRDIRRKAVLQLLATTLTREINQEVMLLLKGFALRYDRRQIGRVMNLLKLHDERRMANAIEILEHLIPKPYFLALDKILDFTFDVPDGGNDPYVKIKNEVPASAMVASIIQNSQMQCSAWTKSVACYLIPKLGGPSARMILADEEMLPQDHLFQETKEYVLSAVK
ncbi:NTP/NDP exchange transporter [Rufibacter latericius]|uniref:ADP,ATP carrier protein n=1 Tax=Rufibacter latericius TaxID=2487040 RepID=A0A3M9M919_9BACT|nr:hypothetical protein [Rufibacter latericius]RNI21976.1 hypothetical protein EFB08_22845 [Rufibacter latericius]